MKTIRKISSRQTNLKAFFLFAGLLANINAIAQVKIQYSDIEPKLDTKKPHSNTWMQVGFNYWPTKINHVGDVKDTTTFQNHDQSIYMKGAGLQFGRDFAISPRSNLALEMSILHHQGESVGQVESANYSTKIKSYAVEILPLFGLNYSIAGVNFQPSIGAGAGFATQKTMLSFSNMSNTALTKDTDIESLYSIGSFNLKFIGKEYSLSYLRLDYISYLREKRRSDIKELSNETGTAIEANSSSKKRAAEVRASFGIGFLF